MLQMVTAASDLTLLSAADLRVAAGYAANDSTKDTALRALELEVAAAIARYCGIVEIGAYPVTVKSEVVTETFRFDKRRMRLILSRRPVTAISSVVEEGTTVASSDHEIEASSGILHRLCSDDRTYWRCGKIVVSYTAGWSTVPAGITGAAKKVIAEMWGATGRDPNLKRVRIEGVSEREYWVPPTTDPLLTDEVQDMLAPYRNHWIG